MANPPFTPDSHTQLTSDQDLGDLLPITEDPTSRVDAHSQRYSSGDLDERYYTPEQIVPRRKSTAQSLSHEVSECESGGHFPGLQHQVSQPTTSTDTGTPRSTAHPPRTIFNKHNVIDTCPTTPGVQRQSTFGSKNSESFEQTKSWDHKAILSLDGGGIRGYSALLIIRELMKEIGKLEKEKPPGTDNCDGPAESSYHPLHPTPSMTTDDADCEAQVKAHTLVTETSPWLPCHYFDYMAGTSTGGLISIMLGRLRMNIDDCIKNYEHLGSRVFGNSRWFHLRSIFWFPREKYNHEVLEEVVQGVVDDHVPKIGTFPGGETFAFDENRCRVVVIAYQQVYTKQAERPYLFRTYKNLRKGVTNQEKLIDRNPGPAHDIPIWQVARATSAAPSYFKEVTIKGRIYIDGGFGANNPCEEIYTEVRRMNNNNSECVGTIISIGTGKNNEQRISSSSGVKEILKAGLGKFINYNNFARKWASDSQRSDEAMTRKWIESNKSFNYVRFNVDRGLDCMKLDEWRARGPTREAIGRMLAKMNPPNRRHHAATSENRDNGEKGSAEACSTDQQSSSSDSDASNSLLIDPHRIPEYFRPKNKTLEAIRTHTADYLSDSDIQESIKKCAAILVDGRRARAKADPQRWERACFGAWYQCDIGGCPRGEREYQDRHALEKHMLDKHAAIYSNTSEQEKLELARALDRCKIILH